MNFACIFFGVLFTSIGLWFAFGNAHEHTASWKAMSEEERAKINIRPLCRNAGEVIALSGIIFLLKGIFVFFPVNWFIRAMIAWFIIAGLDVWHISKSDKYIKK